ncbi:hypothetical protein [Niabella soli]|uniref:Uncharacterized protein n=1 Tax=Niabella soli DSM 19437 TaxID=929713 RepID=W0F413_9BACT|nr:hypothetical protein [Niabella soli]AHF17732.1 hypothetical protein NIASO_13265 [Niabella soli DSM 19437]
MCNCGNRRQQFQQQVVARHYDQPAENAVEKKVQDVTFEYIGKTALTVTGSITRKRYYFSHPDQVLKVDYRDAPGMMAVPLLKKVNLTKERLQ